MEVEENKVVEQSVKEPDAEQEVDKDQGIKIEVEDKEQDEEEEENEQKDEEKIEEKGEGKIEVDNKLKKEELKKKRKRAKKKKKLDDDPPTDYECDWKAKIKDSKIYEDPNLPKDIKDKYAYLENNPYAMIISNTPYNIQLRGLEEYFNTLITSLAQYGLERKPVRSIEFGVLKSWIVLELTSKEAKLILAPLDQLEYIGCKLRIEKPKKFLYRILNATQELKTMTQEAQKYEHVRLYMGGIPLFLNDDDVRKLVTAFGPVAYFNLVKDNSNKQQPVSKGYCFFEYESSASAHKALKALNGLQIADKRLKVTKVQLPKQIDRGNKEPSNHAGSFLASCDLLRIPEVQMMLTVPPMATIPSKVVQFLNMVSPEDLFDDDVYEDLMMDLRTECQLYGNVDKVEIPRPDKLTGYCSPAVGKCYVKFFYQIPAKKCKHHLAGRTYNKRTVITSFYPEDRFDLKDFLING